MHLKRQSEIQTCAILALVFRDLLQFVLPANINMVYVGIPRVMVLNQQFLIRDVASQWVLRGAGVESLFNTRPSVTTRQ